MLLYRLVLGLGSLTVIENQAYAGLVLGKAPANFWDGASTCCEARFVAD